MKDKFKYIQFALIPRAFQPRVKFITEMQEGETPASMPIDKFILFLLDNFVAKNKEALLFDLHSHKIVYLDNETGEHISKNIFEDAFRADFNTLLKLNEKKPDPDYLSISLNKARGVISNMELKFENPFRKGRKR